MTAPRDRAAIALLLFFVLAALTVELYFVVHAEELAGRHDFAGRAFAFYGQGDRGYFDRVTPFEKGLESFNILFTQPLNLLIVWGILQRKLWRYPLQLGVCSYVCYSATLYLLANHLSGYADMPRHDLVSLAVFYVPNLPWVLGNGWMAWDAARAMTAAFRRVEEASSV